MANAKCCDRCGEFYINSSDVIDCTTLSRLYLKKFIPTSSNDKIMDLCCVCKHDLDEWFNKFNKEGANDEEDSQM